MVHYSCDICGKDMTPANAQRYVVKVEAYAAHDPAQLTEEDLSADHVEEMAAMLHAMEHGGPGSELEAVPTKASMRFDLCPSCYQKFLTDPLGRENSHHFDFSNN